MIQAILHTETSGTESNYLLAPDVIFLLIQDGSARLLNMRENCYAITPTGAKMLYESLRVDVETAAIRISHEYHAELALVRNDLSAFLLDLEQKKLLYQRKMYPHAHRYRRAWLPGLISALLLRWICTFPVSLDRKAWALLAIASLSMKMLGWTETIAIWHQYPQKQMPSWAALELEQYMKRVDNSIRTAAANHLFHAECKERALSCWMLLRAAGFSAKIVVGINLFPLECHCWCEAGQFIASDDQDRCEQFTPIMSYE